MVATVPELLTLLDLERIDDDILRGHAPATTLQRVFGGQVLAQAIIAGARTVPDDRPPHSLHGVIDIKDSYSWRITSEPVSL